MKRQEALELESKIENEVAEKLGKISVTVQLTLSNLLKFCMDDGDEYLFDTKYFTLTSVRPGNRGYLYIDDIQDKQKRIESYLTKHKDEVKLLIWSYENRNSLTD